MAERSAADLALYETMLLIRRFEERVAELFAQRVIPGFVHLAIGQEALAAGVGASLRPDDYLVATHRGHGHALAKGADPGRLLAEIFGKRTGYCKGRGGSMHLCHAAGGLLGNTGIVGAGLPIAAGAGLSARLRGTDQVAVAFFGEGAANEGAFHEALNLAALWKLPVLFVCENNAYAELTPQAAHLPIADVAARAAGYGIPGVVVDGNDVRAVRKAAGEAVARARAGSGPTLLEGKTYRWHGHYEGDPQAYRSKEEVEAWKARDPLLRFAGWLRGQGVSEAALRDCQARVGERVTEALRFAQESPLPNPSELLEDVYA